MPTPRGVAQEENAIVVGEGGAKAKSKATQKPAHPWYWYLTPAGIQNEARALAKQAAQINRGYTRASYGTMFGPNLWMNQKGQLAGPSPVQRDILYGGVVKPVKTVANLGINAAQRATNGWKPADPESSPVGRFVKQADRLSKDVLGIKQDEQRRPEDLFWQQMGEMASTSVVGGYVAHGLVPAAAFTTGAFKALAPTAQQALRWTAGVGTESFVSTALTDNRGTGNVANVFGENAPMAVKPQDDMVSALGKSLIPNAGAEIAMGLGFLGATKAIGRGLEGFDNVRRRQAEGRAADEVANARNFTKEAGLQNEADGDYGFTEQAKQPTPTAAAEAAPAAAPTEAAPVASPPTQQQAEDALLGPKGQSAEEEVYGPELPEVDTAVMAADRLDDEQLRATAQGTGPVLPELERQLTEQKAGFQPQEGLTTEMVAAPTANLATPTVPWEDQWSQLPNQTLFSLASPANNPELFDIVSKMTGRSYDQFTWTDVVDGLKILQEQGTTIIPSRAMNSSGMSKTSDLSVNAPLLQYKDGVNAKGQQKGNSLEGVTKWNPEVEQTNLIWDNPEDGKTYMVNGHNSLAKAQELGIPTIPTKRIFANTAGEARLIGAKANIASGGGTAFDAAKIIRELGIKDAAGLEAAGIPLDSGLGTSGLALSRLPDGLFQQAINGELVMGRAMALGGSGLDPADMIRVAELGVKKDISERGFAELVQMASSAPKVADADQGVITGMGEWLKDSSVIEKAELSAKVRAELISNKNLFGKVGKSKAAQALAEKGGTRVNQGQVLTAADVARGVLDEFDRDKYLTGTPISELLNQGAADIAAGAKPAVIKKRILQQLEMAAEAAPPVVKAEPSIDSVGPARWEAWSPEKQQQKAVEAQGLVLSDRVLANRQKYEADYEANQAAVEQYIDESPGSNSPNELTEEQFIAKYGADESTHPQLMHKGGATPKQLKDLKNHNWAQEYLAWYEQKTANAPLTPEMRKQLKAQVVKRAIENGEVRPSATPLPDLPDPPKDLNDPAALLADEARLAQEYGMQNAIADQLAMDAKRQSMGWTDMSLDQKKANGMLDEWQRPKEPVGDGLDERAAYAREQRIAAEASGDVTLAREWQNAERRLEKERIGQAQQRQATTQQDMFGVGQYDDSTPLLNGTPPAPEPGVKRFFHGSASEFKLVEGGEFNSGEMNIYGAGLYTTDSLGVAGKYQKKNKARGAQANGVTYEVVEKRPIKFYDMDAPATPDVLNKLRRVAGYDSMTELVETAISELDDNPSLTRVFDEMRAYSREFDVPAHELQSTWHELSLALEKDGYGGFTHQGGHLAGRGKELHQVRIYWDPANSVDIYKVDANGKRVAALLNGATQAQPNAGDVGQRLQKAKLYLSGDPAEGIQVNTENGRSLFLEHPSAKAKGSIGVSARAEEEAARSALEAAGVTPEEAKAYWAAKVDALSPLLGISEEGQFAGLDSGPIPYAALGTVNAVKARELLEKTVRDAVWRITGEGDIAFHAYTELRVIPREHGGDGIRMGKTSGYYEPVQDIVNVMGFMDQSPSEIMETTFHESWHRIQYTLLTLKDMKIFESAFAGDRVNDLAGMRGATNRATIEKQAFAFQVYADAKARGVDVFQDGIRTEVINALDESLPRKDGSSWEGTIRGEVAARIFQGFDKVLDLIERVNNGIRGRGFESVQSLYEKAYSGKLAKTRALDYAAEFVTPDQKARLRKLEEWKQDNGKAVSEISQMTASIDEQINALKKQAMEGGC